jgi:hypothetical protein
MNQRICHAPKEGECIQKDENTLILQYLSDFLTTKRSEPVSVVVILLVLLGLEVSMPEDDITLYSLET